MLHIKIKKITLPLLISVLSVLFYPALTQAEPYGTGDISATRAAEQRAALAKKAERRKQEAEAKKAVEEQPVVAPAPTPTEVQQEKPAAQ